MKRLLVGLVACSLLTSSGCSDPAGDARKRYEFLKKEHASLGDVCDAANEMLKAYSSAGDSQGYQRADTEAGGDCLRADMDGREQPYGLPLIEPDNLDLPANSI